MVERIKKLPFDQYAHLGKLVQVILDSEDTDTCALVYSRPDRLVFIELGWEVDKWTQYRRSET
jgi:hypothetical protein